MLIGDTLSHIRDAFITIGVAFYLIGVIIITIGVAFITIGVTIITVGVMDMTKCVADTDNFDANKHVQYTNITIADAFFDNPVLHSDNFVSFWHKQVWFWAVLLRNNAVSDLCKDKSNRCNAEPVSFTAEYEADKSVIEIFIVCSQKKYWNFWTWNSRQFAVGSMQKRSNQ